MVFLKMQIKIKFFFFLILPEPLSFRFLPDFSLKNLWQLNKTICLHCAYDCVIKPPSTKVLIFLLK